MERHDAISHQPSAITHQLKRQAVVIYQIIDA